MSIRIVAAGFAVSLMHLLLLPGLACDDEVWKRQTPAFAGLAASKVIDYGASDTIEKMAAVAIHGAPAKFAIAGHSMGGRVAFEVLRRAPERVTGLALLDTAFRGFVPGEQGERETAERLRLVGIAQSQGMKAMARSWVTYMVHPSRLTDTALIDSIVAMFDRKTPEIFAAQINALLNRPDATDVLGAIRCPTLVACGREDSWSVLATHEEMTARISGSRLVVFENCGHMCTMEQPETVTSAMLSWLESIPRIAT